MRAGQVVVWSQYLPHHSVPNKSDIARIAAYYSVMPITENWYGSREQKWVCRQVENLEYYYANNITSLRNLVKNIDEKQYIDEHDLRPHINKLIKSNVLLRLQFGIDSYF